ncbi:MAG TPA: ADOP family duplicated permease [Gemmatimonadales bacterium]|nr:ADOP family duplicated permease [Gemmatimonadales bacterium]
MNARTRLRAALSRLVGLTRRSADEHAMREEMQFHVDQLTERHIRAGMSPEHARRRARIEFGSVAGHEEAARDVLRSRFVEDLIRDLHYGWRSLRRHPGFALTTVLTIALGIAATVTVFTIVDSIFLRPLPVPHAERLVSISFRRPSGREVWIGTSGTALLRARAPALDAVAAHDSREVLLVAARGAATEQFGAFVSPDYFAVLGVRPQLGRFFLPAEDSVPDRDAVAVLGYDLWRTRFAADPSVLGEHIQVRGRDVVVVGVAPPGFIGISIGGAPNDLWLPTMMLGVMGTTCVGRPGCHEATVLARLAPHATIAQARLQVQALSPALGLMAFGHDTTPRVTLAPLRGMATDQRTDYVALAPLLAGIALLLIVISCANVAELLVTRGLSRSPEVALRYSLGADAARVIRQLVTENLLLGGTGGVLGVLLSIGAVRALMGFFAEDSEGFPHFFYLSLDARVLLFALGASLAAVALFGVLPAVTTSRAALARHAAESRIAGRGRGRLALMGAQVALSLTLLVGAALMARSFLTLMHRQQFDVSHMALIRLRPEQIHYEPPRAQRFLHQVVARLAGMPDVTGVAFGRGRGFLWDEGPTQLPLGRSAADTALLAYARFVSPGFLATLRIPLLAGREFVESDDTKAPLVTIVTESVARTLWPGETPLGRTIVLGGKTFRIVGVTADFAVHPITTPAPPVVLVPFWQNAFEPEVDARLAVRVRGDPATALPRLRQAITATDPAVPIAELMTLASQVDANNTAVHLGAVVLLVAALVALFLTGLGLYGVISYLVERRTREIGVRIAIGATPARIVGLVVRHGLAATLAGGATGLVCAALGARFLTAYLIGVQPGDRIAFAAALLAVTAVTCVASYLPARRAAGIDPMSALRVE